MAKSKARDMAVRRRGGWGRLLLALALFVSFLVGWGGWRGMMAVLGSDFLTLRYLEIEGCRVLPEDSLRAILEPQLGRPLVKVKPDSLADLLAALPRVASARVQRRLPGTLRCRIQERESAALLFDGEFKELDAAGRLVPRFGDAPPDLPIIRPSATLATDSLTALALAALSALGDQDFDLAREVSEISAIAEGIVYYRNETPTRVILGWRDFAARARCYREAFSRLLEDGFPDELDLRFRDQVVARQTAASE